MAVGPVGPGERGGRTCCEDEAIEGSGEYGHFRPDRARVCGTAGGGSDESAITKR